MPDSQLVHWAKVFRFYLWLLSVPRTVDFASLSDVLTLLQVSFSESGSLGNSSGSDVTSLSSQLPDTPNSMVPSPVETWGLQIRTEQHGPRMKTPLHFKWWTNPDTHIAGPPPHPWGCVHQSGTHTPLTLYWDLGRKQEFIVLFWTRLTHNSSQTKVTLIRAEFCPPLVTWSSAFSVLMAETLSSYLKSWDIEIFIIIKCWDVWIW